MKLLHFFALMICLLPSSCSNSDGRIPLTVQAVDTGQPRQEFSVELATSAGERAQGLMFRKDLGADRGMLFIFPETTTGSFWMHNTLIPLDIIFIGGDKKIINIVARAEPQTDTPREPEAPYLYVLEIEGGRAEQLGIKPLDSVNFDLP